ncbi:MAG: G1 family glutamic endopeptidase [Thermoplasmata archaeon]
MHASMQRGPVQAAQHVNSGNWAGYANTATSGSIYEVTAEWNVPTVTCGETSGFTYQVSWVGIDGYGTGTVEQAGSLSYCSSPGATPVYYDWWEFYPYNSVQLVSTVGAGDFLQAYILYNPAASYNGVAGIYTLQVGDTDDQAASFQVTGNPTVCDSNGCETGVDGSAECISEAPGVNGGIAKLSDYGTTTFYACADTVGSTFAGIGSHGSHVTNYVIDQIGGVSGKTIQKTGPLSSYFFGKSDFTITWHGYR